MLCRTLVVYYEQRQDGGQPQQAMPAAQPGPGGASQITRLEAKGNVIVTQKDQTATGDNGVFDMKANTVTLINNVVVSQGPNVVRGERLVVDLTTGVSRVDAGASSGPVRMMIQNGTLQPQPGAAATPAPSPPRFGSQRSNAPN
jgi:lipopolysaccharide export system protein LptA